MTANANDLQDLLMDLQHDLGKYIRMPLSFLPADAPDEDVRAALAKALLQTRVSGNTTQTARQLWEAFVVESAGALTRLTSYAALEAAVERVLKWEATVHAGARVDRKAAEKDLAAVGVGIRALLQELEEAG